MNREKVLLIILGVLVALVVPFYLMDNALSAKRSEIQKLEKAAAPARENALKIKEREKALVDHDAAMKALDGGFVLEDPPNQIRNHLDSLAKATGVTLGAFSLQPAASVAELPGVVRYNVSVQVSAPSAGLIAFLKRLEESPYLIAIPDLSLSFRQASAKGYAIGEVAMPLSLGFFGKEAAPAAAAPSTAPKKP